jgi:hypothetical protein
VKHEGKHKADSDGAFHVTLEVERGAKRRRKPTAFR